MYIYVCVCVCVCMYVYMCVDKQSHQDLQTALFKKTNDSCEPPWLVMGGAWMSDSLLGL